MKRASWVVTFIIQSRSLHNESPADNYSEDIEMYLLVEPDLCRILDNAPRYDVLVLSGVIERQIKLVFNFLGLTMVVRLVLPALDRCLL